jgi:hypothetical protein
MTYFFRIVLFCLCLFNEVTSLIYKAHAINGRPRLARFRLNTFQDDDDFSYDRGIVRRNTKKVDGRESLPFSVTCWGSESSKSDVGTFLLDSSTSCGDLLDLNGELFTVTKVSFLYKFERGKFRVFKKKLDVTVASGVWLQQINEESAETGNFLQ